jgi:low affinity Fe/Cu permease
LQANGSIRRKKQRRRKECFGSEHILVHGVHCIMHTMLHIAVNGWAKPAYERRNHLSLSLALSVFHGTSFAGESTNFESGVCSMSRARHSKHSTRQRGFFHKFARVSARTAGGPWAFGLALALILVWLITGPFFQFSDTWQLVINTTTTIVTFLMVFLIQNSQNRDSEALQLKIDELIRASKSAHDALLDIEELSEHELDKIKTAYGRLAQEARKELRAGRPDLGSPEVASQTLAD